MTPRCGQGVYVDPSAQVIGDVELGDHTSVWMNAVVRGDVFPVRIGSHTNVQDGCLLHVTRDRNALHVGDWVTFGHGVIAHGCTIGSRVLLGMGSRILDRARIGDDSIVAAGSVVAEGLEVPPRSLVMGVPARVKRPLTEEEVSSIVTYARNYLEYKDQYACELAPTS